MHISDLVRQFSSSQTVEQKTPKSPKGTEGRITRSMDRSTVEVSEMQKGQTFEGNVDSVKGNKVTLSLSDGSSLTAKVASDVVLSEGESVFFEVKSNDGNLVNIRPVSIGVMQNPILLSALSSAGLPKNEENINLVNNMMQEQLPIDAKSLGDMARAVLAHPDVNTETLVTMQKVGIPLTDEMIQQFENYKSSEGAILDAVTDLVDGLSEAFQSTEVSAKDAAVFMKNLMSVLTTEDGVVPQLFDTKGDMILQPADGEREMITQTTEETEGGHTLISEETGSANEAENGQEMEGVLQQPDKEEGETLQDSLLVKKMSVLGTENETVNPPEKTEATGNRETISLHQEEVVSKKQEGETVGLYREGSKGESYGKSSDSSGQISAEKAEIDLAGGEENAPRIHSLGSVLDMGEREKLSAMLKELNISKDTLFDNTGSLRSDLDTEELTEVISKWMNDNEAEPSKEQMQRILTSDPFKEVLKDVMNRRWTIEPEKVASKEAIKDLYAKLSMDMERLSQIAQEAVKGKNPISSAADSIKNNVDFINQINQAYTYIQLPLKLSGQQATGELYVYTNRKRKLTENDELSAFLHFDLDHLGATDISVKMRNKKVSTNFYMSDDLSFDLLEKNLPVLQEKIEKLGYSCEVKVSHGEEPVDFVEDFLKQDLPAGKSIRRYSFDVTA